MCFFFFQIIMGVGLLVRIMGDGLSICVVSIRASVFHSLLANFYSMCPKSMSFIYQYQMQVVKNYMYLEWRIKIVTCVCLTYRVLMILLQTQ